MLGNGWSRVGSSPHTRGKRFHRANTERGRRIIPAYTGETPSGPVTVLQTYGSSPRTRGKQTTDERFSIFTRIIPAGSSPHTRGEHVFPFPEVREARIIPVHTGETSPTTSIATVAADHPRVHGGNYTVTPEQVTGSSPHIRRKHFKKYVPFCTQTRFGV